MRANPTFFHRLILIAAALWLGGSLVATPARANTNPVVAVCAADLRNATVLTSLRKRAQEILGPITPEMLLEFLTIEQTWRKSLAPTTDQLHRLWLMLGYPESQWKSFNVRSHLLKQRLPLMGGPESPTLEALVKWAKEGSPSQKFVRTSFLVFNYPKGIVEKLDYLLQERELLLEPMPPLRAEWSTLSTSDKIKTGTDWALSLVDFFPDDGALGALFSFTRFTEFGKSLSVLLAPAFVEALITESKTLSPELMEFYQKGIFWDTKPLFLKGILAALPTGARLSPSGRALLEDLVQFLHAAYDQNGRVKSFWTDYVQKLVPPSDNIALSPELEILKRWNASAPNYTGYGQQILVEAYLKSTNVNGAAQKALEATKILGTDYRARIDAEVFKTISPILAQTEEPLKEKLRNAFPSLNGKHTRNVLFDRSSTAPDSAVFDIVTDQDRLNTGLNDMLDGLIQSDVAPEAFRSFPRPWSAFLRQFPTELRYEATRKILNKRQPFQKETAQLIAQIDPLPGSREAVIDFLLEFPGMHRGTGSIYAPNIMIMFNAQRWKEFFPNGGNWRNSEVGLEAQFALALRTSGRTTEPGIGWVRAVINDPAASLGIYQSLGFVPFRAQRDLLAAARGGFANLRGIPPLEQVRGLIVQSHYERSGFNLINDSGFARGAMQVESDAPEINWAIENSLNSGVLGQAPALVQKLFVNGWSFDASGSRISSIRNDAITLADWDRGFWDIRVGIHNFPTPYWLDRAKQYRARRGSNNVLNRLIENMEAFLGLSANSSFSDLIASLPAPGADIARWRALAQGLESWPFSRQMQTVSEILKQFQAVQQAASKDSLRLVKSFRGQQRLNEFRLRQMVSQIDRLPNENYQSLISTRESYLPHLLDFLESESFIDRQLRNQYTDMIDGILRDPALSEARKVELYAIALENILNRIYYSVRQDFGRFEDAMSLLAGKSVPRFTDAFLRSTSAFALGKYVDFIHLQVNSFKQLHHRIGNIQYRGGIEVFNPGETVGILRVNKDPMRLGTHEIAVFKEMPFEMAPCAGMITIGAGARLSHVQLLAKALKIPNVKASTGVTNLLESFDGRWVRMKAAKSGELVIESITLGARTALLNGTAIQVPQPQYGKWALGSFGTANVWATQGYAGAKGSYMARAFVHPELKKYALDGEELFYQFFRSYADIAGITPWLDLLAKVELKNKALIALFAGKITAAIDARPIPSGMLDSVISEMKALQARTQHQGGYFFRSDTNLEDLTGFNGAGLNVSVANVPLERGAVDAAIRRNWSAAFLEKSIYWRGLAVGTGLVPIAIPSIPIMPTVNAKSSGVLITRGGPDWKIGYGSISANWGIGSVVESGVPVEEFTFESGRPVRYGMSASFTKPVMAQNGGLVRVRTNPTEFVLTDAQALEVMELGAAVERAFGEQKYGWDIEWAFDQAGRLILLQARPNMPPVQ